MKKPARRLPNTTPDGALACAYGTPWLDHFPPLFGTGLGCTACDHDDGHETVTRAVEAKRS